MIEKDFIWSETKEPHHHRRLEILRTHPEVKKLFGTDRSMAYKALLVWALQLSVPLFFLSDNPWIFIATIMVVGTTLNHIIVLAIHEITHDLVFEKKWMNSILAIIVNFPLVFPFSMSFKAYHAEHHWHQGHDGVDVDIASKIEGRLFNGFFGKFFWMFFQIPFYALRPLFIYPLKPDKWILLNIIIQISFMVGFYFLVGWWGLLYLFLSLILAGGLHPLGGHFVSEHVVFKEGQETYSYYGPLNKLVFNVGYHNEHHDFPNVPGSRLPELKRVVGAKYDNLYSYNSWVMVIIRFLTSRDVSLFSRVKRTGKIV